MTTAAVKSLQAGGVSPDALRLAIIGENPVRLWGMTTRQRLMRMAGESGIEIVDGWADADLIADARFAFDPTWFRHIVSQPESALVLQGEIVLAHVKNGAQSRKIVNGDVPSNELLIFDGENTMSLVNVELRKKEAPFVMPVTRDNVREVERASYMGAYKGVTDLLTKYLWPRWAFILTRIAARCGLSPNMITGIGLIFCIGATFAFLEGQYWSGMLLGLTFMVLDTVDGKLARCTITSSRWGNIFDHGIDLIHPPIWWWAWAMGLSSYGLQLAPEIVDLSLVAIFATYILQRMIEGAFIAGFRMHIHVWRAIDSRFRLITARRNPNMLLLFCFLCMGRPDWGLIALAIWSLLSCMFHVTRLIQAWIETLGGRRVTSWLG